MNLTWDRRVCGRRFVFTWLSTAVGGAERSVVDLAHALAVQGHEVAVLWWDTTRGTDLPAASGGVDLRRVTTWTAYRSKLNDLLATKPSVLITTHRTAAVDIAAGHAGGACVIAVLRAILVPDGRLRTVDPATGMLVGRCLAGLDQPMPGQADCWVGVSAAAAASLDLVLPPAACRMTIYNGVPLDAPAIQPRARTVRFGVVARLVMWKRLDRIIAGFSQLPTTLRGRLEVYGDGPQRRPLAAAAARLGVAEHVTFHGYRHDWRSRALDVLVCASMDEAFGRAIVEAGLAGIPAIVPAQGGSAELVLPGVTGLRFNPADPTALATVMTRAALWDPATATRFAVAAQVHARRFNIARCAAAYAALATDLQSRRSRRQPAA
jgi:glycosyltransferase involved in cell wall biosynthesis